MYLSLLFFTWLFNDIYGKTVEIALRENVTLPCPNGNFFKFDNMRFKIGSDILLGFDLKLMDIFEDIKIIQIKFGRV
jgi:hypothetical protein